MLPPSAVTRTYLPMGFFSPGSPPPCAAGSAGNDVRSTTVGVVLQLTAAKAPATGGRTVWYCCSALRLTARVAPGRGALLPPYRRRDRQGRERRLRGRPPGRRVVRVGPARCSRPPESRSEASMRR